MLEILEILDVLEILEMLDFQIILKIPARNYKKIIALLVY